MILGSLFWLWVASYDSRHAVKFSIGKPIERSRRIEQSKTKENMENKEKQPVATKHKNQPIKNEKHDKHT